MALSIKKEEADRLARELARETGESITDAVVESLRERLERVRNQQSKSRKLRDLVAEVGGYPVLDDRSPDLILGFDESGLPR